MSTSLIHLLDDELLESPLGERIEGEADELQPANTSYFYEVQGPPDEKTHVHLSTGL